MIQSDLNTNLTEIKHPSRTREEGRWCVDWTRLHLLPIATQTMPGFRDHEALVELVLTKFLFQVKEGRKKMILVPIAENTILK